MALVACTASACTDEGGVDETPIIASVQLGLVPDEAIAKRAAELSNAGVNLGAAVGVVQPVPGGAAAHHQRYTNYVIVYTNDFGAVYMPVAFFDKWTSLDSFVYSFIGVPLRDVQTYSGGLYDFVTFERGEITREGSAAPLVTYGDIFKSFASWRGFLGAPRTEESGTPGPAGTGRRFQVFANGEVYWWPQDPTGLAALGYPIPPVAWPVFEPMLSEWKARGGAAGSLGVPIDVATKIVGANGELLGLSGRFEHGTLIQRAATSTAPATVYVLTGRGLADAYQRHGGPAAWLGWPKGSSALTVSGKSFADFDNGVIVERLLSGRLQGEAFGDLGFHLVEATGDENCTGGGEPDTFVKATVNSTDGVMLGTLELPENNGYFHAQPAPFHRDLGAKKRAHSGLSITAAVEVLDRNVDTWPSCSTASLGTASFTFNVDNLWGLDTPQRHNVPNSTTVSASFNIKSSHDFDPNDFRGEKFWSFSNFTTTRLSEDVYDAAFVDIDSNDSNGWDLFKRYFYDFAFKGSGKNGNCNGMVAESTRAERGQSAVAMPIHDHYADTQNGSSLSQTAHPDLYRAINIQQGSQLGIDVLLWRGQMLLRGMTHAPGHVFNEAKDAMDRGDFPLIGLTDDLLLGAAHSVRPYRFDGVRVPCTQDSGLSGQCARIFVADPNFPTRGTPPEDPQGNRLTNPLPGLSTADRFIEVTSSGDQYSYLGVGVHYRGNMGLYGRMLYEPARLYAGPQKSPTSVDVLSSLGAGIVIFGASGKAQQITDEAGRTMFKSVQGVPLNRDQLQDDALRIPNLAPVSLSDSTGDGAQIWVGTGSSMTHTYDVAATPGVSAGTPVDAMFHFAGLSSTFTLPATPGKPDRVILHDINGPNKAMTLAVPSDGTSKAVTWTVAGGDKKRWMELSALGMSPGRSIRIRAENAARKLFVQNDGPTTTAVLRYNDPQSGTGPVTLGTITIQGFGETVIEPGSAQCLSDSACPSGQRCIAGACVPSACSPSDPFTSLRQLFPGVRADGIAFSPDRLTAYVSAGTTNFDIHVATRPNLTSAFGALSPVANLNTLYHERGPWLSPSGLELYFSTEATASGQPDLVRATRPSLSAPFGTPQPLTINTPSLDRDPFFVQGSSTLYFASDRSNSQRELFASTLNGTTFSAPQALAVVNDPSTEDAYPVLTADGLTLYFKARRSGVSHPNVAPDTDGDIWTATRASASSNFGSPAILGILNTSGVEFPVAVSPDGCSLFIVSNRDTGLAGQEDCRLYEAKRGTPPANVTMTVQVIGNAGDSVGAPINCAAGSTCTITRPYGTTLDNVLANRSTLWTGGCESRGSPGLSTDAVFSFTVDPHCIVQFQ